MLLHSCASGPTVIVSVCLFLSLWFWSPPAPAGKHLTIELVKALWQSLTLSSCSLVPGQFYLAENISLLRLKTMIIKDVTVNRDGREKQKKRWRALKGHTALKASAKYFPKYWERCDSNSKYYEINDAWKCNRVFVVRIQPQINHRKWPYNSRGLRLQGDGCWDLKASASITLGNLSRQRRSFIFLHSLNRHGHQRKPATRKITCHVRSLVYKAARKWLSFVSTEAAAVARTFSWMTEYKQIHSIN